ncbi:HEAT repeat domain-containing protein [Mangrovibacterium marinum]|uniref:HEAT repeat protein n=1 Tax=Mangrovibacterium marinum TaxID=1639118 RepID=A0A2T5C4E6_9BACT|nr:HEAT repeat domain-containing protein [Mangrovibacterium marinum]PTN09648.1 HEAT repeat protein [Mangrovibacterium marinum]
MSAEQPKKINTDTIHDLQSGNAELVNQTIEQLSESGNSAYLPFLFELLHSTTNEEIKRRIARLLAELKHSDAIPLIIEAIQNKTYDQELQYLVSACWENGLDYIDHLPLFVDLMIEQDFLIALEAHTVITNMTGKIAMVTCEQQIQKIEAALPTVSDDKRAMLEEVIEFLKVLEQGIEPQSF